MKPLYTSKRQEKIIEVSRKQVVSDGSRQNTGKKSKRAVATREVALK